MKQILQVLILLWIANPIHAQTGGLLRLVAEQTYRADTFVYIITDSSTYRYSGVRTSNMKTGNHEYDSSTRYQPTESARYLRTYDANNRLEKHTYQEYISAVWANKTRFFYGYTTATGSAYDTVLTQEWNTGTWTDRRREKYRYTGTQLDTINRHVVDGGVWQPESRDIYIYDAGNIAEHRFEVWNDTLTQWDVWSKELYSYDAGNKLDTYRLQRIDITTLGLVPSRMETYTYDGAGFTQSHSYYSWFIPSATWEGVEDHLYTYNANNDIDIETVNNWDFPSHSWGPYRRKTYNYDLSFNLADITEKQFNGSAFVNVLKSEWLYNSYNLPTIYRYFQWNTDGVGYWRAYIGDRSQITYRYEQYFTSIEKIKSDNNLRIYPNPASGFVNISMQWQQSLPFTVQVYDMQGRLVYQQSLPATRTYNGMLHLPGLTPGNYILQATNSNEEMTKRLIIAGQ